MDAAQLPEGKQSMSKKLKEGLNAQQRSVPQLPAQAHAKKINVLGSKTDPKHPFSGYMVGADESVEQSAEPIQESPFSDDHSELDQFVKEEWNTERTGDWTGEWDVSLNTPPNYRVKVKAPTAEFAVDQLRKRGMSGFKDAADDQIDVSPITHNSMKEQPINEGWNDFTVDGYRYEPWEEEEFDRDNKKIHHSVRTPAGEVVSVDWDPYEYMEPGDLKSWIDLGMPTRQHAGTIGPLRADHLDQLAAQKKTVDETSFADAGEVVGGIVGGPAAFALARGRGGKKTYAAGSVAGSAIGNAAGRWIDKKIAPAAGVDQHGPGPMAKRYTKPIDESPETLYFFDVANTTGSYTDQQLRSLGLKQTRSGKWYYKPIGNNTQAVDAIAQRLNVQPKPWTPVREGNPAADWPMFGESQDNTVASHTFADTGSAFRNGQEDAMNFRPKNDAKYIRGHKYRSNYSDGYKYGLTQQDRSINPKTGQPYVLFGPNGPTTDSDPERSMHGDGPHVWVCSSYRQAKKQADKWGQKVARAGVSKWKVVPKDDPAPEIFSESDLNEVTGDKSFDSMMGNIVKGARYKGAKADQQADTAYGNMIQGITNNTNAVRQPSSNSKFEQIYNQVERILLSSHIHSEIDYDIMDALEKLKIKSTDKLIQKLESALVSRVSDVLQFYDESDLEEQALDEVTGDLPFDTMLSKIVAGGNLQTLAAKIVAKIKKFPQYRMPGDDDRDEFDWPNGYPDGHFFGDDLWIDDSFDSIMEKWKSLGPDKFADENQELSFKPSMESSNDYTSYWNGVLAVLRRLESIPGATEQLAKMVWHGLFSGNVEKGITDIGKPGVAEADNKKEWQKQNAKPKQLGKTEKYFSTRHTTKDTGAADKEKGVAEGQLEEANIQPTGAMSRSHIGNLSNPVTNSVVHPSSGKEIGLITQQPTGEYYAHPSSTGLAHSQGATFATKDEAHQFIRNAHAKAIKNGTLSDKWQKKQPLPQFAKGQQGVAEGFPTVADAKADHEKKEKEKGTGKFEKKTNPESGGTEYTRKSSTYDNGGKKSVKESMSAVQSRFLMEANLKRMAEEHGQTLDEMMAKMSEDMKHYRDTGECSAFLRDCMDMHGHNKKLEMEEAMNRPELPDPWMGVKDAPHPAKPSFASRVAGTAKSFGQKALSTLGHPSDEEMLKDLERKAMDEELDQLAELAGLKVTKRAMPEATVKVDTPDEEPVNAPKERYATMKQAPNVLGVGDGDIAGGDHPNHGGPGDNPLAPDLRKPRSVHPVKTLEAYINAEYESIKKAK